MPRFLQTNIASVSTELINSVNTQIDIEQTVLTGPIKLFDNIPDRLFTDTLALGYIDEDTQSLYYKWAIQGLDLNGASVLDAGCGRGDFFKFVLTNVNVIYSGIDNNPLLIEVGRNKYNEANLRQTDWMDISSDELYDWTFNIFGISYIIDNPLLYLKNTIIKLLSCSAQGLILILLKTDINNPNTNYQTYKVNDVVNILEELNIFNFGIDCTLNGDSFKVAIFQ